VSGRSRRKGPSAAFFCFFSVLISNLFLLRYSPPPSAVSCSGRWICRCDHACYGLAGCIICWFFLFLCFAPLLMLLSSTEPKNFLSSSSTGLYLFNTNRFLDFGISPHGVFISTSVVPLGLLLSYTRWKAAGRMQAIFLS